MPIVGNVTVNQLQSEREANATRFDATYKDKWVVISGRVDRIDNGKVYLVGDGFLSDAVLEGLSVEEQVPLDAGQTVTYTCKVGNYILGSIILKDCHA